MYHGINIREVLKVKIITINLPLKYLKAIQVLDDLGICESRSSFIRGALKDFLGKELKFNEELDNGIEELIKKGSKTGEGY